MAETKKPMDKLITKCREGCTCTIKSYIPQPEKSKVVPIMNKMKNGKFKFLSLYLSHWHV